MICVATNNYFQVETVDDWWGLAKLGQPKWRPIFLDGDAKTLNFLAPTGAQVVTIFVRRSPVRSAAN